MHAWLIAWESCHLARVLYPFCCSQPSPYCPPSSGLLPPDRALYFCERMLDLGALATLPSFEEKVPLIHLAAAGNLLEVYRLLVAKGVKPLNLKDSLGRSALHFASAKGSLEVAKELLELGLKPYLLDMQRNTPLHLAGRYCKGHSHVNR